MIVEPPARGPCPTPSQTGKPDAPPNEAGHLPGAPDVNVESLVNVDLNELRICETVGTGSTAEVFKGTYLGRTVAIKQIFKLRSMDIKEQVAFNREVSVLAKIKHKNLVQLYGVAFSERPYKIVTEFCEGGTLFELLHNCREVELNWDQRLKMCSDVASGMDNLHTCRPQVIHRDLKSLNLLLQEHVDRPGKLPLVKVTDFGLSRMKDPEVAWGKMTAQVGTMHWMAPEVFQGTDYDQKVDVYSYAMVLFEIMCRDVPFRQEDPGKIGQLTSKGGRPGLEAMPKDTPPALRDLMFACWEHDPQDRPPFSRISASLDCITGGGTCTNAALAGARRGDYKSISL